MHDLLLDPVSVMGTLLRRRRLESSLPEPSVTVGSRVLVVAGVEESLERAGVVADALPSSTMTLMEKRNNFRDQENNSMVI